MLLILNQFDSVLTVSFFIKTKTKWWAFIGFEHAIPRFRGYGV